MTYIPDIHALEWCQDDVAARLPRSLQGRLCHAWRVYHDDYAPDGFLAGPRPHNQDVVRAVRRLIRHGIYTAQQELNLLNG